MKWLVKKYVGQAGLNTHKYSAHKLRHTAATLMYQNGVDIRTLQTILRAHKRQHDHDLYPYRGQQSARGCAEKIRSHPFALTVRAAGRLLQNRRKTMKILNFGSLNIDNVYTVEEFVRPGDRYRKEATRSLQAERASTSRSPQRVPARRSSTAARSVPDGGFLASARRSRSGCRSSAPA